MSRTSTSRSTSNPPAWDPKRARFFSSRRHLRDWFEANHATALEIWIGFYKAHTGRASVGYPEAVEEALCFGWIDTTVRRIDEDRYANRFVPRRSGSQWSRSNRALFTELTRRGLVTTAGHAAFDRGRGKTSDSYEKRPATLSRPFERIDASENGRKPPASLVYPSDFRGRRSIVRPRPATAPGSS